MPKTIKSQKKVKKLAGKAILNYIELEANREVLITLISGLIPNDTQMYLQNDAEPATPLQFKVSNSPFAYQQGNKTGILTMSGRHYEPRWSQWYPYLWQWTRWDTSNNVGYFTFSGLQYKVELIPKSRARAEGKA